MRRFPPRVVLMVTLVCVLPGCRVPHTGTGTDDQAQRTPPYKLIVCGKAPASAGELAALTEGELAALARSAAGEPVWTVPLKPLRIPMIAPGGESMVEGSRGGDDIPVGKDGTRLTGTRGGGDTFLARAGDVIASKQASADLALAAATGRIVAKAEERNMRTEKGALVVAQGTGGGELETRTDSATVQRREGAGGLSTAAGQETMGAETGEGGLLTVAGQEALTRKSGQGALDSAKGSGRVESRGEEGSLEIVRGSGRTGGATAGDGSVGSVHGVGSIDIATGEGALMGQYRRGSMEFYDRQGVLDALERRGIVSGRMTSDIAEGFWREDIMAMGDVPAGLAVRLLVPESGQVMYGECFAVAVLYCNTGEQPLEDADIAHAIPVHAGFEVLPPASDTDEYDAAYEGEDGKGRVAWHLHQALEPGEAFVGVMVLRAAPWVLFPKIAQE